MDKKLFGTILLINLLLIFAFLSFSQSSSGTDITNVIAQHYKFLEQGQDLEAFALMTKGTQKVLTAEEFTKYRKQVGIESTWLDKAYQPVVKDDWAAACYVITNKLRGKNYTLFNLAILQRENGKWSLVGDLRAVPGDKAIDIVTMWVKAEKQLDMDKNAFAEFSDDQETSLREQLKASYEQNKAILGSLKKYNNEKDPKKKEIKQDVYEEDPTAIHGAF